ncbi:nucleotidyltransferase domain-containing protein [candidate division KSB1 bacterium]|nr:nucleotidyltransferase domain-containing protein [candidate division KSB1 bacterium]
MFTNEKYQTNLKRALEILKDGGCTEVFLFGSVSRGEMQARSDIDLAIRGCPTGEFFKLMGKLLYELDIPVDLVDMEHDQAFADYLTREGELIRIG